MTGIPYNRLVAIAKAMRKTNQEMRKFHVAFILRKGRPLVIGINRNRTHPASKAKGYKPHQKLHAELNAVLCGGKSDYSGCDMVVIRIDNNNNANNSKPCQACGELIGKLGFRSVSYSNSQGGFSHGS